MAAGAQNTSGKRKDMKLWDPPLALQTTDLMCTRDGLNGSQCGPRDFALNREPKDEGSAAGHSSVVIRRRR